MHSTPPEVILVVSDERTVLPVWTALLEHEGYRILLAYDGPEGAAIARKVRPDLILTLYPQPMWKGSFIRFLKDDPDLERIRTCAVLSVDDEAAARAARDDGADCMLPKDAPVADIVVQVGRLLSEMR